VGDVPTPWTAFSFVGAEGRSSAQESFSVAVKDALFPALHKAAITFVDPVNEEVSVARICKDHGHTSDDARAWLRTVKYADDKEGSNALFGVDRKRTDVSLSILKQAGIVDDSFPIETLFGIDNKVITFVK